MLFDEAIMQEKRENYIHTGIDLYVALAMRQKALIKQSIESLDLDIIVNTLVNVIYTEQKPTIIAWAFKMIRQVRFKDDHDNYINIFLVPNIDKFAKASLVTEEMVEKFQDRILSGAEYSSIKREYALSCESPTSANIFDATIDSRIIEAIAAFNVAIFTPNIKTETDLKTSCVSLIRLSEDSFEKPTSLSMIRAKPDKHSIQARLDTIKQMPMSDEKKALLPEMFQLTREMRSIEPLESDIRARQAEEIIEVHVISKLSMILHIFNDFSNDRLIDVFVRYSERAEEYDDILSLYIEAYSRGAEDGVVSKKYLEKAEAIVRKHKLSYSDKVEELFDLMHQYYINKQSVVDFKHISIDEMPEVDLSIEKWFSTHFVYIKEEKLSLKPPAKVALVEESEDSFSGVGEDDSVWDDDVDDLASERTSGVLSPAFLSSAGPKWVIDGKEYIAEHNMYKAANSSNTYVALHEDIAYSMEKTQAKQFQSILDNGPKFLSPQSRGVNGVKRLCNLVELKLAKCKDRPFTQLVYLDDEGNKLYIFDHIGNHAAINRIEKGPRKGLREEQIKAFTERDEFEAWGGDCSAAGPASDALDEQCEIGGDVSPDNGCF